GSGHRPDRHDARWRNIARPGGPVGAHGAARQCARPLRISMKRYDAILFDFDGVLIDSEPLHFACWAEVLAPLGVRLEWEFYSRHCIGIDDREMLRMMATRSDPPRAWEEL